MTLAVLILSVAASAQTSLPKEPAPQIPPGAIPPGQWNATYDVLDKKGKVTTLTGRTGIPAELEDGRMLFRADSIEYDESSGDVKANGHVFFHHFEKNERIWASRVEYNTEGEHGTFFDVKGEMRPRVVTRPGVLSVDSPFHFEGEWATRAGERYTLYNGWVTNCKLPKPWWRLRGPKFIIEREQSAKAYKSIFMLRNIPLFYIPYFYHSLEKEPRKSGFLFPNFSPNSQRGFMVGLGYYWAINRSYDLTYHFQDFTSNAFTHHVDFRGKPRPGTDFDVILYGVQDRGMPGDDPNPPTYSGVSLYLVGRSDLGKGWIARGFSNYISSYRFRQQWSQSYAEVIGSEIQSVGDLTKNWSTYSVDLNFSRLQNFQSVEIPSVDPVTGDTKFLPNAVTIRKLPELSFVSRDRSLLRNLPLWFSLDSAAGLLFRSQPIFNDFTLVDRFETHQFTNRIRLAPHLTSAFHLGNFHIVPSVGFQETFYGEAQARSLTNPGLNRVVGTNIVRSARDFSLDLIFPSLARIFPNKTVFGDKLKHVIEPRATYRYVTGIGTDFNRFIRFDESDLFSNTNELLVSLTNRVFAKRGDTVQEIFTWELMQKRYFDPTFGGALLSGERNVFAGTADLSAYAFLVGPRNTSPVASLLRASPITGLGIQWQADFDPRYSGLIDSSITADYRWSKYVVLVGNNRVHNNVVPQTPPADQFHFRTGLGDANRRGLNAGFDMVYDYRKAVVQYSTSQVTYNTDCCGISVQYRRYNLGLRDDNQVRIAFAIGNVGTLGTLRKQDRLF